MKYLFFLISLIVFSSHCFATAGARGGGTGISCPGKRVMTLEEYLLEEKNKKIDLPPSYYIGGALQRYQIEKRVGRVLGKETGLFKEWKKIWRKNGDYDYWDNYSLKDEIDFLISNKKNIKFMSRYGFEINKLKIKEFLEFDDNVSIPSECKKEQLSVIRSDKPYKTSDFKLSSTTKRTLELHESFFLLGMSRYRHFFPVKTRNLVMDIISNSDARESLEKFSRNFNRVFQSYSDIYFLAAPSFPLSRHKEEIACPAMLSYLMEDNENIYETMVLNKINEKEMLEQIVLGYYVPYGSRYQNLKLTMGTGILRKRISLTEEIGRSKNLHFSRLEGRFKLDYSFTLRRGTGGVIDDNRFDTDRLRLVLEITSLDKGYYSKCFYNKNRANKFYYDEVPGYYFKYTKAINQFLIFISRGL